MRGGEREKVIENEREVGGETGKGEEMGILEREGEREM